MPTSGGNPYHDRNGRFATGSSAATVAAQPGTGARPTPPTTPPVFTSADGGTTIHVREGAEPTHEVWKNGELIDSGRATRAWRTERAALIAKHGGEPPPAAATPARAPAGVPGRVEGQREELHRLLHEESVFADPTGDTAAQHAHAGRMAQTWADYGDEYGADVFSGELNRARRAAGSRERAKAVKPTVRQELELTNLIAENKLAENPALNRDKLYAQTRADVSKVSAQGLGKHNALLASERARWYQREQEQYGNDIERTTQYHAFDDGGNP
ncbi:MAG: hypothetical protein WCI67_06665 [Chloroflexales bacterium]